MSTKFSADLEVGQRLEHFLSWLLRKKYNQVEVSKGKFKFYDIHVLDSGLKLECKYDRKSKVTKNIAIEYQCFGKPSGISSTQADQWVIQFWDETKDRWTYGFVQVADLRTMCEGKRSVCGGDGFKSFMYLLPKKDILASPFFKLRTLEKELVEYTKVIAD